MTKILDNPARRLYRILNECKNIDDKTNGLDAWAKILNTSNHPIDISYGLTRISKLPGLIFNIIERDFPEQSLHAKNPLTRVSNIFLNHSVGTIWGDFKKHISQDMISNISLISAILDNNKNTLAIEHELLINITEQLTGLASKIIEDNELDGDLRKYLLESIKHLQEVIETYELTGLTPLVEISNSIAGKMLFDPIMRLKLMTNENGNCFLKTIGDLVKGMGIYNDTQQFIENMKNLLPPN